MGRRKSKTAKFLKSKTFKCTIVKFGMWIISGTYEDNFCDIDSLLFAIILRKKQYHHYIEIEFVRLEAKLQIVECTIVKFDMWITIGM